MSYNDTMNQLKNKTVESASKATRGFTLVEILIVLALIGIIAGLAMGDLGSIFAGGKEQAAKTWVNSTGKGYVNIYNARVGNYPKTLADLKSPPNGINPFVTQDSQLLDPWKKPYQYKFPGTKNPTSFDLWTENEGKIFGNWDAN